MSDYHIYTDHDLLLLIREDDARAFTEIYHRYWKRMFTLALHRLNSRPAAEDVVQDVFSGLWHRRHQWEINTLGASLAVATRYAAFRQLAQMKSTTDADQLPEAIYAAADDTAARFLQQSMQEELQQLPEKCRLVFHYSRNKGWTNREISQQLQISEKAVEKHITKALQRLRIQLKHYLHTLL